MNYGFTIVTKQELLQWKHKGSLKKGFSDDEEVKEAVIRYVDSQDVYFYSESKWRQSLETRRTKCVE
ncbi:Protein of unknown function [Gryllus bimaculatus]|nr:Protein of unknown function [Gryllus bimaculatus]